MTDMDAAHRRDYKAKSLMDDAALALKALHDAPEAIGRLTMSDREEMARLRSSLEKRSAHIVVARD